ncbi:hypothetical protein J2T56_001936 [Natronobacillus azotifigens]|uniref:Class IIb bacteriocin, lactobin A/cerein 7B family n=1 Tax=Natronobacillus azotifigens TaxID=472978 RepID=A0A9J6REB7_9BACI|nr:hypothetical protein [Natronobacillus azotifigens]MCZ0703726.1 hypothetical protein [Natronobacillus azotifigens]
MENILKINKFDELSNEEITDINGGLVITGGKILIGIAVTGYKFGEWVKNAFFK